MRHWIPRLYKVQNLDLYANHVLVKKDKPYFTKFDKMNYSRGTNAFDKSEKRRKLEREHQFDPHLKIPIEYDESVFADLKIHNDQKMNVFSEQRNSTISSPRSSLYLSNYEDSGSSGTNVLFSLLSR